MLYLKRYRNIYNEVVNSRCGLINLDSSGGGGARSSTSTINTDWLGSCWEAVKKFGSVIASD